MFIFMLHRAFKWSSEAAFFLGGALIIVVDGMKLYLRLGGG